MICPRCSVAEISPLTNRCELCGYAPSGGVAVEAPRAETVDELARLELADQFSLDILIGLGANSAVYLAREAGSDRLIVVKALPRPSQPQPEADERFRHAVEAVMALDHPHIVPVFGCGTTEHVCWYSMEHVHGQSLRGFTASRGPLDMKACLRIVAQVASALDYAHRRGVVHGALKPENVLIDDEGWVHVCDPLVTRALEAAPPPVTQSESALRAEQPPYVAPEDIGEGMRTPFSDQYALAALVFEALTGSPPPEPDGGLSTPGISLATMRPDLPSAVVHAVRRAMSPRPTDRFPSILDFVAALESYSQSSAEAQPGGRDTGRLVMQTDWKPPVSPWRRRIAILAALAVVALLAVVLRPAAMRLFRAARNSAFPAVSARLRTPPPTDSAADSSPPADAVLPAPAAPVREARPRTAPSRRQTASARQPARQPTRPARARAPSPLEAAPDSGRLSISTVPWGQLFVDGRLVGNTPKAGLMLAPGTHAIRVVREGFAPVERTIQVRPGQDVRLTDIALVARQP